MNLTSPSPLQAARNTAHLSVEDLADLTNYAPITIRRTEQGLLSLPAHSPIAIHLTDSPLSAQRLSVDQEDWIKAYRLLYHDSIAMDPATYKTARDRIYLRNYIRYVKTVHYNAENSATFQKFLKETFGSVAAACRMLKVNLSSLQHPVKYPDPLSEAFIGAGFDSVNVILKRRFFNRGL